MPSSKANHSQSSAGQNKVLIAERDQRMVRRIDRSYFPTRHLWKESHRAATERHDDEFSSLSTGCGFGGLHSVSLWAMMDAIVRSSWSGFPSRSAAFRRSSRFAAPVYDPLRDFAPKTPDIR
jgi:hypothetical protein